MSLIRQEQCGDCFRLQEAVSTRRTHLHSRPIEKSDVPGIIPISMDPAIRSMEMGKSSRMILIFDRVPFARDAALYQRRWTSKKDHWSGHLTNRIAQLRWLRENGLDEA